MTAAVAPSPRSEPLLWLQLLGLGVMPLEALLLLLLLAGADPGPLPALERLLCWAIGSLAPAFLLWRRPADVWSLLLVQAPLRARRPLQQRLSRLQSGPLLQAGLVLGCLLSLALLWWIDDRAALAGAFSPVAGSPRLVALLLAAALLALLLWQWQQLLQSLWLLSRNPELVAAAVPMTQEAVAEQRLPLGIPLLLLDALTLESRPAPPTVMPPKPAEAPGPQALAVAAEEPLTAHEPPPVQTAPLQEGPLTYPEHEEGQPASGAPDPQASDDTPAPEARATLAEPPSPLEIPSGSGAAVAIEPEQGAADQQGGDLDQQIG